MLELRRETEEDEMSRATMAQDIAALGYEAALMRWVAELASPEPRLQGEALACLLACPDDAVPLLVCSHAQGNGAAGRALAWFPAERVVRELRAWDAEPPAWVGEAARRALGS